MQEQACLLNEGFGSLFSSPCTLQKIEQQVQRGEKETIRSKVNVTDSKAYQGGFLSPANLRTFKCFDLLSLNGDQHGDAYGASVSQKRILSNWTAYGLP